MSKDFLSLINNAQSIVIIQADNPDGDSLASSLALEALLLNLNKNVSMFCAVNIPTYLRHIEGWDRVYSELPSKFDLSIIVDTSSISLLETLNNNGQIAWIKSKPCIIIDHHNTKETIDFADLIINENSASTGQVIYNIANKYEWLIEKDTAEYIAYSILFDTLGMISESVTSQTLRVMADLIDKGVSLAKLDNNRRLTSKKSLEITEYKGKLLQRVELNQSGSIAVITIPWPEIEKYSSQYNPSMLVLDEMRMIDGVMMAIAFKTYPDGKITAKLRSNYGSKVAGKIAEHFGGGGHAYASGFKILKGKKLDELKKEVIEYSEKIIKEDNNEII